MSRYNPGDVLLVPFPFAEETALKLRPAIVVALGTNGDPVCCPIRSSLRAGSPGIPIGIDDFMTGGLDLFSESYVQTDTVRLIQCGTVAGKKGVVTREFLAQVSSLIKR
jgi:mRNA interferase MazF